MVLTFMPALEGLKLAVQLKDPKSAVEFAKAHIEIDPYPIDVHTLEDMPAPERLELNDIGIVRLRLSEPLLVDPYEENRLTGAFVLIDEATNETVGAGMVLSARP